MVRRGSGPAISVIVPCYNKPHYLKECLASIQVQSFSAWECIVVSDGSPWAEEIKRIFALLDDPRFRFIECVVNRGPAAARNTGISQEKAGFLLWVDEDDLLAPLCLSTLYKAICESNADIVCPQGKFFGGREGIRGARVARLQEILEWMTLLPAGFIVRKEAIERGGVYYDEHPVLRLGREDHEWWIRVIKNGLSVEVLKEVLYFIRRPCQGMDLNESLDFRASRHDFSIYQYIVNKHADVYARYPKVRKEVLRTALNREATYCQVQGDVTGAALRAWKSALMFRKGKDFRGAIRITMNLLLGTSLAGRLVQWARTVR